MADKSSVVMSAVETLPIGTRVAPSSAPSITAPSVNSVSAAFAPPLARWTFPLAVRTPLSIVYLDFSVRVELSAVDDVTDERLVELMCELTRF